jgi:RHS repeat-associated protein
LAPTVSDPLGGVATGQRCSSGRTYGVANVLNQTTSENGVNVDWDDNGNMTSGPTLKDAQDNVLVTAFVWGTGNRLVGANRAGMTATYDYDSDDRRTRKIVNGVTTYTLWSGAHELGEYDGNGALIRRFIPDGNGAMDMRAFTMTAAGAAFFHHVDRQGSVIATSDSTGAVIATAAYSPYGEFADGTSTPPTHSPFGYTGRQYDPETGLYQYRARYYSPRLGVFLSTDPIGTKDDPNLYGYVGQDPVNKADPTGEACIWLVNSHSTFCRRTREYMALHREFRGKTSYFGAVSMMTTNLANLDVPGTTGLSGITPQIREDLEGLSQGIMDHNQNQAERLRRGDISGTRADIDRRLVIYEQKFITAYLENMDPERRSNMLDLIDRGANGAVQNGAYLLTDTDVTATAIATRTLMGGPIRFEDEWHRTAMGLMMVNTYRVR